MTTRARCWRACDADLVSATQHEGDSYICHLANLPANNSMQRRALHAAADAER